MVVGYGAIPTMERCKGEQVMPNTSTRTGKILDEHILDEFKAGLRGELIRPGDAGYDEARQV
jgi:hypothetical protein